MTGHQPHDPQRPGTDTTGSADSSAEPQSLSLLGGIAKTDELTEAERLELDGGEGHARSKLGQGAILIVLAVLVTGGILYGMRLAQGELATDANQHVEARIEAAIARLTQPKTMRDDDPLAGRNLQALFEDTESIVAMFAADRTASQVPIDYVQKNPFTLHTPIQVETPEEDTGPSEAQRRAQQRAQLESEIQGMRLQSVMGGRTPIAIINNEFLRVGQTLGSFTVAEIVPDSLRVVLEHDGHRFTLNMQDD